MILGIGSDLIEVERVKNSISKIEFKNKVFSADEIAYCEKDKSAQSYAARFAAKEAFFKALGTGWEGEMALTEVEILNGELNKPYIRLSGKTLEEFKRRGGNKTHVTLSHIKETAIAFVIIEKD